MFIRLLATALVAGLAALVPATAEASAAPVGMSQAQTTGAATYVLDRRHHKRKPKHKKRRRRATSVSTISSSTAPTATGTAPLAPEPDPARDAAAAACGSTALKADGSYWQCTFADDFDGTSLDLSKWTVQTTANSGFRNGPECYVNDPDNVRVADGVLRLTARLEPSSFPCGGSSPEAFTTDTTGGMVTTYGKFSQAYGRFAFRAKFADTRVDGRAVQGSHSALWMWPQDQSKYGTWPGSGEIDVAEAFSAYPDRLVPYLHYTPVSSGSQVTNTSCLVPGLESQFHDIVLEWVPGMITIQYDDQAPCVRTDWLSMLGGAAPFDQPFVINLTQALGNGGNVYLPGETKVPVTLTVDSVKVWK